MTSGFIYPRSLLTVYVILGSHGGKNVNTDIVLLCSPVMVTDVSEECIASISKVERSYETLETT
jgi:hypothetical protein